MSREKLEIIQCVYMIICKTNPKIVYIGSTSNFFRRLNKHYSDYRLKENTIYNTMRENGGIENFDFVIVEKYDNVEQLIQEEAKLIKQYKTDDEYTTLNTKFECSTPEELNERNRQRMRNKYNHNLEYKEKHKEYMRIYMSLKKKHVSFSTEIPIE